MKSFFPRISRVLKNGLGIEVQGYNEKLIVTDLTGTTPCSILVISLSDG